MTYVNEFSRPHVRLSTPRQHHPPTDNQSTADYRKNTIMSPISPINVVFNKKLTYIMPYRETISDLHGETLLC